MICSANQLTGFYMMGTLAVKGLKALFVLEILTFLPWHVGYVEKRLDEKAMMSQTGKQIITIHILFNVLRSKDNQTVKFGQLIEYNIRNNFLEKSYTKYCGKASPSPFYKKSKFSISLDQQSEML